METIPENRESVPELGEHRERVPELGEHRDSIPKLGEHRERVPELGEHRETVPELGVYRETVPELGVYRETVPELGVYRETVPELEVYRKRVPELGMYRERVPERGEHRDSIPELAEDRERVPELAEDRERVPELAEDRERVPELAEDRERVPELAEDRERVPELAEDRERVPELGVDRERVPELGKHRERAPRLREHRETVPELGGHQERVPGLRELQESISDFEEELESRGPRCLGGLEDLKQDLFQDECDSSSSDYGSHDKLGSVLPRLVPTGSMLFPDIFQTNNLLFYERFRAYQDYMLADCKPSEVREFTAEYLENALEHCGWQAVWRTDVFEVLVQVVGVECSILKAVVKLCLPFVCESRVSDFTQENIQELLEVKEYRIPLQELYVVFDDSGEFDQTALAIEHLRFFYQNIWRPWDEEDEDDFDYFVRCAEPRLRLHYDILEDRVPSGLVTEYQKLLSKCNEVYKRFSDLRNSISSGSDSDSDTDFNNVSMVEGIKMYDEMESLKRRLKLIENPLLRYVFCYQRNSGCHTMKVKGPRASGGKVIHVVSKSMSVSTLQCLTQDRLQPECQSADLEIEFHNDPLAAVNACYEGDLVIICPGHYIVDGLFSIADSIEMEGYGLPDDIVIEKRGKGDNFVDCTGAHVRISNVKFVQHDAVEGIVSLHGGKTELDNCVLQCETTGVTVRTSAELLMKYCDLYGAKGAGVEIYPGSNCSLIGNGIHHCKEGVLIKDFIDEICEIPKITMENNVIHNNEGYAVVLVKPAALLVAPKPNTEVLEGENIDGNWTCKKTRLDLTEQEPDERMVVEPASQPCDHGEEVEGNHAIVNELVANSRSKRQIQKKRLSALGITKADDEKLTSQEMFVSISGNQFKRNGKGSFGTFLF